MRTSSNSPCWLCDRATCDGCKEAAASIFVPVLMEAFHATENRTEETIRAYVAARMAAEG